MGRYTINEDTLLAFTVFALLGKSSRRLSEEIDIVHDSSEY